MKTILILSSLLLSINLFSSSYFVVLDHKHYKNNFYVSSIYNENGFTDEGIHRNTGTQYNPEGYDINGLDKYGKEKPITCDVKYDIHIFALNSTNEHFRATFGTAWETYVTTDMRINSFESAIDSVMKYTYRRDGNVYGIRRLSDTTWETCQFE